MSGIFWSNPAVIRTLTLSLTVVWVGCAVTRYEREKAPPSASSGSPAAVERTIPADTSGIEEKLTPGPVDTDSLKHSYVIQSEKVTRLEEENQELSDQVSHFEDRIKALEDLVKALPEDPKPPPRVLPRGKGKKSPPKNSKSQVLKARYKAAHQDFMARRFRKGMKGFSDVLQSAPKHNLADNAQYWIGECYYGLEDYIRAVTEFQKVFSFPDTEKNDDAQLKIGICYLKLGEREKAVVELKRLTVDYPESEYVGRAKALLKNLWKNKR